MAASMPSPAQTPPPTASSISTSFNIHESYLNHLNGQPPLPPGLAAISALTTALSAHQNLTTISEAISLLSTLTTTLKSHLSNPLPVAAGTDAFLHHLVTTAARPTTAETETPEKTTQHVLDASKRTIDAALQARRKIASLGRLLIRDSSVVVLLAQDDLLREFVLDAADSDVRFRVLLVEEHADAARQVLAGFRGKLHARQTPTASIPPAALAHTLTQLVGGGGANGEVMLLSGAAALLADGGVLAPMGTLQGFMLARMLGVARYVVCETWKGVKVLPLPGEGFSDMQSGKRGLGWSLGAEDWMEKEEMDVTPPEHITSIITERGPLPAEALSEESIKFWF